MVKIRDGGTSLTLNKNQEVFGQTKYGTFQIMLSDLKKPLIWTVTAR